METTTTRGARVCVHSPCENAENDAAGIRHWRPFPFNQMSDSVSAIWGCAILFSIAPVMGVLIGFAELVWAACKYLHKALRLQFINDYVLFQADRVGRHVLRDPRNSSYLPYIAWLATWTPFLFIVAYYLKRTEGFSWTVFFVYHFLRIGPRFRFFAHQHVLLHKEGHDKFGLFKEPFHVLNYICQWFIGPFFGQVPHSYSSAHNKIHHRFDNGLDDVHTNLDLDRSEPYSMLVYTPRFFLYWSGISPLAFFISREDWRLARDMGLGMVYYYGLMAALFVHDWQFCLAFFVFPFMESVVFFAAISYLWHAFVNPEDPDDQFVNSVTILNGRDNIWNEDYHVVHHVAHNTHWSDYPAHYAANIESYKSSRASIFKVNLPSRVMSIVLLTPQDTEEGEMLVWMLTKQWAVLADHFVDLSGTMTHDEKVAMLLRRLRTTLSKAQ